MGNRLKRLRDERHLTQEQLAAAAGIPVGSLRNYEQDHREPRVQQLQRLARALNVSMETVLGPLADEGK